jgi:hypothetical protein
MQAPPLRVHLSPPQLKPQSGVELQNLLIHKNNWYKEQRDDRGGIAVDSQLPMRVTGEALGLELQVRANSFFAAHTSFCRTESGDTHLKFKPNASGVLSA